MQQQILSAVFPADEFTKLNLLAGSRSLIAMKGSVLDVINYIFRESTKVWGKQSYEYKCPPLAASAVRKS